MTTQSNLGLFKTGKFFPYVCNISNIVKGPETIVTTSIEHMYVKGNSVRFVIPKVWGMVQLNLLTGFIVDVPTPDSIVVNINSLYFDSFVAYVPPSPYIVVDYPQVIPVGDANTGKTVNIYGTARAGDLDFGGIPPYSNTVPGAFNVTFYPEP